jgi:hypothetical protein
LSNGEHRGFPFRWALPIAQLAVCTVLLWPLRHFYAWQLQAAIHTYRSPSTTQPPQWKLPVVIGSLPMDPSGSALVGLEKREVIAASLNLPAGLVQVPYAILSAEKREWSPRGVFFFQSWRAVSWPVICISFWRLAGLGIEALMAARQDPLRPRIGWVGKCVVALVFASGSWIALGVLIDETTHGVWQLIFFGLGGALRTVLSGLTIAGHVFQWRIRRRLKGVASSTPLTQPTVQ